MDAVSESDEIQKGLSHLCMSITPMDQNIYSQARGKKREKKLSTVCIWLLKILSNKVEITTLISE